MLPYVILMFAPLLVYQVAILREEQRSRAEWYIAIGKKPNILNNSLIVPMFFLLYFLLLALRHEMLGSDMPVYKAHFLSFVPMRLSAVFRQNTDPLYALLNWIVGQYTNDYQVFLVIVAAITVFPVAKIYSEDKQYGFLKIVLFMNMSVFVMLFSGLRQSISMAIGMIAYNAVRKKRPLRFLLWTLVALGFHHTGFVLLLYYPLYHLRLKIKHLWFVLPVVGAVFVFNNQIFTWAARIAFSVMGDKYDVAVQETGAYTMIILFALFTVAAYFFPDENKMDEEAFGLRNFLLMALLLQCFAPVHTLAMRMNYYFIIFVPVIMPKVFKYSKDSIAYIGKIAKNVIIVFFVIYYLYTTYESCQTGESALFTYPYRAFWE